MLIPYIDKICYAIELKRQSEMFVEYPTLMKSSYFFRPLFMTCLVVVSRSRDL